MIDNDIDLLLVVDTKAPFTQRGRIFEELFEVHPALDILVYAPREFISLKQYPESWLSTEIQSELVKWI